ncbi:gamma-glutamyltransferase [Halovulum marinum]|uniref:gamma-glutamyltransferase n=1 Tax=Halovulum marinum TaxID=2662447 RepID=UPI002D79F697|nr:gamma-glutamyltransferase [Halovulum marinum]
MLKNPDFARTLRLIAAEGSAPSYHGVRAGDIVAAVKPETNPGIPALQDMAECKAKQRDPVCVEYRSHEGHDLDDHHD